MAFNERTAERVREVLAKECIAEERRMFGGLAFMVDGHMCCGIVGDDLVVRVGSEGHKEVIAKPNVREMDFTGRPMKGFVYIKPAGYRRQEALKTWIQLGVAFVKTLPPKA